MAEYKGTTVGVVSFNMSDAKKFLTPFDLDELMRHVINVNKSALREMKDIEGMDEFMSDLDGAGLERYNG